MLTNIQFFHVYAVQEICNKGITKDPIRPKTRRHTTL